MFSWDAVEFSPSLCLGYDFPQNPQNRNGEIIIVEKLIFLQKLGTKEFAEDTGMCKYVGLCRTRVFKALYRRQNIEDERWSLLASQELSRSPLWLLQPLHLRVYICQGCRLYRPAEVLRCALAVTVCRALSFSQAALWWLPPTQWTSMQGLPDVLDVGHSNFSSTHPLRASTPLSTGFWSPLDLFRSDRLRLFFTGKWWKMTPQKQSKIPVFLFKRLLQAEKMVAHENRSVTDSHMLLNVYVCKIQG